MIETPFRQGTKGYIGGKRWWCGDAISVNHSKVEFFAKRIFYFKVYLACWGFLPHVVCQRRADFPVRPLIIMKDMCSTSWEIDVDGFSHAVKSQGSGGGRIVAWVAQSQRFANWQKQNPLLAGRISSVCKDRRRQCWMMVSTRNPGV